jgi:hypothetical protein
MEWRERRPCSAAKLDRQAPAGPTTCRSSRRGHPSVRAPTLCRTIASGSVAAGTSWPGRFRHAASSSCVPRSAASRTPSWQTDSPRPESPSRERTIVPLLPTGEADPSGHLGYASDNSDGEPDRVGPFLSSSTCSGLLASTSPPRPVKRNAEAAPCCCDTPSIFGLTMS